MGAGPSLINQRLVVDAGEGDATQGGKRGAQKGRGPEALSLPPLTQLIGLGASARDGIRSGGRENTTGVGSRRRSRTQNTREGWVQEMG